jgi:L-threonylcarbamoyladenylate synthase
MLAMENSQFLSKCSADAINSAAQTLINGNLVAFPTETVYGLGADALNSSAVARIYEVKGRPHDHPLIVHVPNLHVAQDWFSEIPDYAIKLAREFWPGPMTLILNRSNIAKDFITGGQDTVGIRVPNHPIALALLEAFSKIGGKGIAAPSANRFGYVSPTTAPAVSSELGNFLKSADQILDGGACMVGVESTIIDCTRERPRILRPGEITEKMIVSATDLAIYSDVRKDEIPEIRVSGSLESHYAPRAKVILDKSPTPGQGLIALADFPTPEGVIRLASPKTEEEFAHDLYASLCAADVKELASIVVIQPQSDGIAAAIRDRLKRAANGR